MANFGRTAGRIGGIVAVLVAFVGCGGPPGAVSVPQERPGGPGGRLQDLGMSPEQEIEIGRKAYQEVLREFRDRLLPEGSDEVRRVRQVTSKIVRAAGIEPLQREINLHLRGYRFDWQVNVVRGPEINAFCLPGGRMVVFTGILPIAEDDDQLATVLGHEISHALAHHANERVTRDQSGRIGFLRNKSYDRQQEFEADHIGLFLMTFAGYDPDATVRFWRNMEQRTGGGIPEFLSDHPSGAHRIENLAKWAPQARAGKKAFDEGRVVPSGGR